MTGDQMLFGDEGTQGVDPVFGTRQANTVYCHRVRRIVSEKANLTGASLCEAKVSDETCIPIGVIRTDS